MEKLEETIKNRPYYFTGATDTHKWHQKVIAEFNAFKIAHVVIPRKQLEEDYDKALAEPSDEMDKLENVCMLIRKLLGKEKNP